MQASHGKRNQPPTTEGGGGVAVVGAGISGLAAARELADHGVRVSVLDKGRGVGGRTSIRREGDFQFDHGAQYFTVYDERFRKHVTTWIEAGIVSEWPGRIVSIQNGQLQPCKPQTRYVGMPGMNAVARHLSRSLDVKTHTLVASIEYRHNEWLLQDDKGQKLGRFQALILALPAPQAASLLIDMPQLAQQVQACTLHPCWSLMLAFESRLDLPYDGALVQESPLSWIARDSSKPSRPQAECWVLHASPAWSANHLEIPSEDVCKELLTAFEEATGHAGLRPCHSTAHRWRYAQPREPLDIGCIADDRSAIVVCGDWCQGGRIEGAFVSGTAAASRVLSST